MSVPDAPSRPARSRASIADVWWLAVAGAVFAALVHVAQTEFRFRVLKQFTWTSREFAWLSLGGYLAWFLVAAIPVALLVTVARRWAGLRLAATLFASLSVFAILLLYQKIHPLSQVILAIGIGSVIGARIAASAGRGMRWMRRLAIAGALALGITGLLTGGRLSAPSVPAAGTANADLPNIVLLILDTVRASSLSLYGYGRPTTPVLERLAKESTVFDAAFSAAPWTAPSHASMMTGLWASQAGADYLNPMYDSLTTVAQVLTGRGYSTGGFMSNAGIRRIPARHLARLLALRRLSVLLPAGAVEHDPQPDRVGTACSRRAGEWGAVEDSQRDRASQPAHGNGSRVGAPNRGRHRGQLLCLARWRGAASVLRDAELHGRARAV